MSGQPPPQPPQLSYKSRAKREQEERERKEREERERKEREEQERLERERLARERAALRAGAAGTAPPFVPGPAPGEPSRPAVPPPPPSKGLAMFEEDKEGLSLLEVEEIELLGGPEEVEVAEEEEVEEVAAGPRRMPPRPPKSPDMRPVYAGFILVITGLVQFLYGIWAMVQSPTVASGIWSPLVRWGAFSMGFTAAFLGLLAIRGGLWSFRKERFSVVKVGAIAATACVWAFWIPWLFGAAALLIITRARDEYYPFYDPRWDAPSWASPPPGPEEAEGERAEGEGTEGEKASEGSAEGTEGGDALVDEGDGWEMSDDGGGDALIG